MKVNAQFIRYASPSVVFSSHHEYGSFAKRPENEFTNGPCYSSYSGLASYFFTSAFFSNSAIAQAGHFPLWMNRKWWLVQAQGAHT